MTLNKVLIDTNVCLDAVLNRKPFAANALELIERSEKGDFAGILAAHSLDTLFFILNKKIGKAKAYKAIRALRKAFQIAPVTEQIIDDALKAEWDDFEDAIHYQAAREAGCQTIITRNSKDFKQAELTILSPLEFLNK